MISIKCVQFVILARKGRGISIIHCSKRVLAETDMIYAYILCSKCGKTPEMFSVKCVRLKILAQMEKGILHGQ